MYLCCWIVVVVGLFDFWRFCFCFDWFCFDLFCFLYLFVCFVVVVLGFFRGVCFYFYFPTSLNATVVYTATYNEAQTEKKKSVCLCSHYIVVLSVARVARRVCSQGASRPCFLAAFVLTPGLLVSLSHAFHSDPVV